MRYGKCFTVDAAQGLMVRRVGTLGTSKTRVYAVPKVLVFGERECRWLGDRSMHKRKVGVRCHHVHSVEVAVGDLIHTAPAGAFFFGKGRTGEKPSHQ
jgi:hypothetical protein